MEGLADVKTVLSETPARGAVTLVLPSSAPKEANEVKQGITKLGELRLSDEKLDEHVNADSCIKTWWKRAVAQRRAQRSEVKAGNPKERPGPAGVIYVPRGGLMPLSPAVLRKALTRQSDSLAAPDKACARRR